MKFSKWVIPVLLIGLLAAGCISSTSQQTEESTPLSTLATPGAASSPKHLPENNPAVTPRPGWAVYTNSKFDIVFQLPSAWQRVERNGAAHDFEGSNGYVFFNDKLLSPMFMDENVEKICQNQIDFANKKYQEFGQKPYGSQPKVISLQVDHQPACLTLPSADQDENFAKTIGSFLIAKYPADLEVEPGEPRFLTIEADKDHIQSIADTVHFTTKETGQPVEELPNATPFGLQSSSDEIRDHLLHPDWNTLWVDGYSVTNFDGETATFFVQAWIDRDGGGRLISSDQLVEVVQQDASTSPRFVWTSDGAQIRFADLWRDPIYVQDISPPLHQHPLAAAERAGAFILMLLPKGPDDFPYFFRPIRVEPLAERKALVVEASWDASSPVIDRFWVDQLTGVILRSQGIGNDGKTIVHESSIEAIRYNPVLPPAALSLNDFSNVHFEDVPSLIPSSQAPTQPDTISISASAPATYTATIPVSETLGMNQETIIRTLFDRYLNYFKTEPVSPYERLDDYEIASVDLDPRIQTLATIEKRADYVAWVNYSVKPVLMMYSDWVAGNGTLHADKWIRDKILIVGVVHEGSNYRLVLIGTGP